MSGRFNLYSPEVWSNPYPFYAELRRNNPVCQIEPGGLWAVTRYDDVHHVLKNPQLFSSEGLRAATQPAWLDKRNPISDSILVLDPPNHTRLRALVTRAFGPTGMARLEPFIRSLSASLTAQLMERREVDFMQAFALPLPAGVLGQLLGLDLSLASRFKRWADDMVNIGTTSPENTAQQARLRATLDEMEGYVNEVVEKRRREPGEDLVSDLLRARVDGEALTQAELMGFLFLLLVAGLETTVNLLGICALTLADHPDVMQRLRADNTLIPRFVEEVLRHESPSQSTMRVTTAETELGGVRLPAGSVLMVLKGSANRDETYFPEPDRFDLDRPNTRSLIFGHGIHFCLGAQLARLEAKIALETLLAHCGRLERKPGPVQWGLAVTTRGPAVLPVLAHPT